MHPRIYGTELEYGVFSWDLVPKHTTLTDFLAAAKNKIETVPALRNGGRLYFEGVSHPEYCTPECLTPREVAAYERAGDLILEDVFRDDITTGGVHGSVKLYRTSVGKDIDGKGVTHGYHENYLVPRAVANDMLVARLVPFLVTRVLYAGAGNVNNGFAISGRARHIETISMDPTTSSRPIVNTRDQPLADSTQYRRLHLIAGEPNMAEYATYLRVGATGLVLDLIEDGTAPGIEIEEPVKTYHQLATMTSGWTVKTKDGPAVPAVDVQRRYLSAAQRHFRRGCGKDAAALRSMNRDLLSLWERTLDALERDPYLLAGELDWVAEKRMLDTQLQQRGALWSDPVAATLDLKYHETGDGSIFYRLQRNGFVKRLLGDSEIIAAMREPPATRAKGRSLFVQRAEEHQLPLRSSDERWDSVSVSGRRLDMPDPFNTYVDEVEEFFMRIKDAGAAPVQTPSVVSWPHLARSQEGANVTATDNAEEST